jgi:membrane-bound lytic murein transglycosylase B
MKTLFIMLSLSLFSATLHADDAVLRTIERRYGLPDGLLNAVWFVESSHGTLQGDYRGVDVWNDTQRYYAVKIAQATGRGLDTFYTSSGGAMGHFQILPSTWWRVKQDGNGDGLRDPYCFEDSAATAALYLSRQIALMGLERALKKYSNNAAGYAQKVAELMP